LDHWDPPIQLARKVKWAVLGKPASVPYIKRKHATVGGCHTIGIWTGASRMRGTVVAVRNGYSWHCAPAETSQEPKLCDGKNAIAYSDVSKVSRVARSHSGAP